MENTDGKFQDADVNMQIWRFNVHNFWGMSQYNSTPKHLLMSVVNIIIFIFIKYV